MWLEIQTLENPPNRIDDLLVYHAKKSLSNQGSSIGMNRNPSTSVTAANNDLINTNDEKMLPEISIGTIATSSSTNVGNKNVVRISHDHDTAAAMPTPTGLIPPPLITRTAATPQGSPPTSISDGFFPPFPSSIPTMIKSPTTPIDMMVVDPSSSSSSSSSPSSLLIDDQQQQQQQHHQSMVRTIFRNT